MKVISQSLRHANIGITVDTYTHLLLATGKIATELFDKLLKPWLAQTESGDKRI